MSENIIIDLSLQKFIDHITSCDLSIYYDSKNEYLYTYVLLPSMYNKSTYHEIFTYKYKHKTYVNNSKLNKNLVISELKSNLRYNKVQKIKDGIQNKRFF